MTANRTAPREADREPALQQHYKLLNRHLQAALLHARSDRRRERTEPCGGDSATD